MQTRQELLNQFLWMAATIQHTSLSLGTTLSALCRKPISHYVRRVAPSPAWAELPDGLLALVYEL